VAADFADFKKKVYLDSSGRPSFADRGAPLRGAPRAERLKQPKSLLPRGPAAPGGDALQIGSLAAPLGDKKGAKPAAPGGDTQYTGKTYHLGSHR